MWITAEMMADIYNQDAYSRQVAQEAIEQIQHSTSSVATVRSRRSNMAALLATSPNEIEQLRRELMRVAGERDTATRERDIAREELRQKSEILADMSVRLEAVTSKVRRRRLPRKRTSDLRGADARLVTHINNLQEQLYAERNNNRRLKGG